MQNKTVDEYIKEMRELKSRATVAPDTVMGKGGLIVVVNEAQSRPLANAKVRVKNSVTGEVMAEELTDISGKTPVITLDAPQKSDSLSPSNKEAVYALYDVTASADNYLDFSLKNVPIFDSVISIQTINLLWIKAAGGENMPTTENEANLYNL